MLFIFVYVNAETTVDVKTGISKQLSFAITADTLNDAVQKMVDTSDVTGSSGDPNDYYADIDSGNISVEIPTVL